MTLREKYLYGFKMIELYSNKNYEELDKLITEYEALGNYLLFELKYKFLANNELINYVKSRIKLTTDYYNEEVNIKELHLNGSHEEKYVFKFKDLTNFKINELDVVTFLSSRSYFIESFYLKTNFHNELDENIKEIMHNKYLVTDIVSFSLVFENNDVLEVPFYWYSDNDYGVNYLQRAAIENDEVLFSFDTTKQSNNYFKSYAMEELIKYSKSYSYDQEITSKDVEEVKLIYVNLGVGSILNSYEFIEEDLLKLVNLESVVFVFEGVTEQLTIDISNLNKLEKLKEISFENEDVQLLGMDKIIGKKIIL